MFSVVIPLFNKKNFVLRAIESVFNQSFHQYEIILVDDGSTDGGADIVERKYEKRVKVIRQKNQGVSNARNRGIKEAKFPYIAFLDSDDYWSPHYLEKNATVIQNNDKVKIIGSHFTKDKSKVEQLNKKLDFHKIDLFFKTAIKNTLFSSSSSIVAKEFFDQNDGFNPKLKSGEDLDVWFRAILSGGNAYYINNTLVYYSDEDVNKLYSKPEKFQNRFIANIDQMYFRKGSPIYTKEFHVFLSKFVYSGLFQFYSSDYKHVKDQVKSILKNNYPKYFLAELYYKFPFLARYKKISRKYFKFIFRFIYN